MTEKLNIVLNLSEQDPLHIDTFLEMYGANIESFVLKNGGNEEDVRTLLTGLISDLCIKNKEGFDYSKYKVDPLVMTICILLFKKRRKEKYKDRSPLIIDQDYYEPNRIKLSLEKYHKIKEKYESILEGIGEPGRTILKLTFNDRETDQAIVDHVHLDSVEQLNSRRMRFLDRCIENLML